MFEAHLTSEVSSNRLEMNLIRAVTGVLETAILGAYSQLSRCLTAVVFGIWWIIRIIITRDILNGKLPPMQPE